MYFSGVLCYLLVLFTTAIYAQPPDSSISDWNYNYPQCQTGQYPCESAGVFVTCILENHPPPCFNERPSCPNGNAPACLSHTDPVFRSSASRMSFVWFVVIGIAILLSLCAGCCCIYFVAIKNTTIDCFCCKVSQMDDHPTAPMRGPQSVSPFSNVQLGIPMTSEEGPQLSAGSPLSRENGNHAYVFELNGQQMLSPKTLSDGYSVEMAPLLPDSRKPPAVAAADVTVDVKTNTDESEFSSDSGSTDSDDENQGIDEEKLSHKLMKLEEKTRKKQAEALRQSLKKDSLTSDELVAVPPTPRKNSSPTVKEHVSSYGKQKARIDSAVNVATNLQGEHIYWKQGELIGKGAFGDVYMAMDVTTGELMAVKTIRLMTSDDEQKVASMAKEIGVMEKLRHHNIVSLLGNQYNDSSLHILMEYVAGKSVYELLKEMGSFSEKLTKNYTKQLLDALSYCHASLVIHRDVKAMNILINSHGVLKLADFGSSKFMSELMTNAAPSLGYNFTPLWTAPEVISGDYNSKVDIWSVGCVMIEMCTALPPWSECSFENPFQALYHIGATTDLPKLPVDKLSPLALEFLQLSLTRNPKNRPDANQLLQHPWMATLTPPPVSDIQQKSKPT